MTKKCFDNYSKDVDRPVTQAEQKQILKDYRSLKRKSTVSGITQEQADNIIDSKYAIETRQDVDRLVSEVATQDKIRSFNEKVDNLVAHIRDNEPKFRNKAEADIYNEAIARMIFTTNKMSDISFEAIYKANKKGSLGEFFREIESIQDFNINELRKNNSALRRDVLTELFELYKDPTRTSGKTKNSAAFTIAKSYMNVTVKQVRKRNINGEATLTINNRLRPKLRQKKLQNKEKEFVRDMTARLDPEVHGTVEQRTAIAQSMYDDIMAGKDWREIGSAFDTREKNLGIVDEIDPKNETVIKESTIAFKDGESFEYIVKEYGANDVFDTMLGGIDELARKTSLTQFFGPNFNTGIDALENIIKTQRIESRGISQAALRYVKRTADPFVDESSAVQRVFVSLRNWQAAAKLGGAVITALLDVPTMINGAKNLYRVPATRVLKNVFGFELKGSKSQKQTQARYLGIGVEGLLGNLQERFALRGTADATYEKGMHNLAYKLFKYSGLNWWTDGRKAMSANILLADLGDNIARNVPWSKLNKQYRSRLSRFGIDESDWGRMIDEKPLSIDGENVFDLHAMTELDSELSFGRVPLKQRLHAFIDDGVDSMVITPSQIDVEFASLFTDPRGTGGQIFKSMLQFKAHPLTFFRKQWLGDYGSTKDKFRSLSTLTLQLTLLGAGVVMLKDIAAGRNPRELDDPELWIRAIETGGAAGILTDLVMSYGGKEIVGAVTGADENEFYGTNRAMTLLGPLLGDFIRLTGAISTIGAEGIRAIGPEDFDTKKLKPLTNLVSNNIPFQNLWYTKMLYRKYLHEAMIEYIDPKGYRQYKKRYIKEARDERMKGKYNNIIYETLP